MKYVFMKDKKGGLIMDKCKFNQAWIGECGKPTVDGSEYCKEHKDEKCCSCGSQATRSCSETGQFVCGAPLCDDCDHTTFPDGTNGGIGFNEQKLPEGMKRHCKKTEQKYTPWFMREEK